MKRLFISVMMIACLVSCSEGFLAPLTTGEDVNVDIVDISATKAADINHTNTEFALKLFNEVSTKKGKECFISPASLSIALSMTAMGAVDETYDEIAEVLGHGGFSVEELGSYYKQTLEQLVSTNKATVFENANSIWVDKDLVVKKPFLCMAQGYYDATIAALDMNDGSSARKINDWVSDHTNGHIKNIVKETSGWRMALVNALYFRAKWSLDYDAQLNQTFTDINGNQHKCTFLADNRDLRYAEDEHFQFVELPYKGNYSMDVILPKNYASEIGFMTADLWDEFIGALTIASVDFSMPEFETETSLNLNDALMDMGVKRAFSGDAQFDAMATTPLMISDVLQKTWIKVTHKGTEAAASTIIGIKDACAGPAPGGRAVFRADKPFMYAIRERRTGAIIFIGCKLY